MATFTAGTSFTDGVTGDVTAAKLNALVANATPLSNFITDRTAETSIATDDLVLISDTSDSGALNKMTVANFTNIVSTGTGTSADPAIRPTSDTNTGIFFPAADTIAFSEGGTEAMRIDSSGNVGIGTTDFAVGKLAVNGDISINANTAGRFTWNRSGSYLNWIESDTGFMRFAIQNTEHLRIDSSGNVGIGTTSPSTKLHVASGNLRLDDNQYILWGGTTNGINGNNASNLLAFYTNSTERLRIDSSGNVGIGTASPSGPLHIRGATGRYAFPATSGTTQSNGLTLRLNDASDDNAILDIGGNSTSGYWLQVTNNANLATNYPLLLNPNGGNVGIGTTSPSDILHVSKANGVSIFESTGVSSVGIRLRTNSTDRWQIGCPSASADLAIYTGAAATERLRITSGGQLLVGTTSENTGIPKLVLSDGTIISYFGYKTNGVEYIGTTTNHPIGVLANNQERLRITSGGEVYIAGTTDQGAYNLQVNGTGVWGAGAYVNGSDERLKENIQDITSGLDVVEKLRPVSFQYKEDYTADRSVQSGFIAQDLLVALEGKNYLEGVVSQGPTYYNVAYQNLIPILAKAIQELKTINNSQAQTITSLESRITALEAA